MQKKLLVEGGNLILRSKDGSTIAAAEKIDFNSISRRRFLKTFRRFFIYLNKIHERKFNTKIWKKEKGFYNGKIFNGSSKFLFNEKISNVAFKTFKQSVGDIDLTVPERLEPSLRKILELLPKISGEVSKNISYIGVKESKRQLLFLFEYNSENGPKTTQVDFEFVEYENGTPTVFEQFIHSADWNDIKNGIKGSLHKILIQSIAKGISKISASDIITYKRGNKTTAKRHRNASVYSFAVPEGLRVKYKPEPGGKYRFQPPGTSERIQDISKIFYLLFKNKPNKEEIRMFYSFQGTLKLMKKYFNKNQIEDIFETYISKILHKDTGMTIDRRMSEDQITKERSINFFYENIPFLKKFKEKVDLMKQVFYNVTHFKEQGDLEKSMEKYL